MRSLEFHNCEGFGDYSFELVDRHQPGISAMLRAKNEAETILASVISIEPYVDEVVVVDNGSCDGTANVIDELTERFPGKVKRHSYPFDVTKCGHDFQAADENSVRSLVYYYNWSKAKCRYRTLLKWDADMIVGQRHNDHWRNIRKLALDHSDALYWPKGRTVIRNGDRFYLDESKVFMEPRIYPNNISYVYFKKTESNTERIGKNRKTLNLKKEINFKSFEIFSSKDGFYEIKDFNKDEFNHWSKESIDKIMNTNNNMKKQHELNIFKNFDESKFNEVIDEILHYIV